jgi:hypothetical protein
MRPVELRLTGSSLSGPCVSDFWKWDYNRLEAFC